MKEKSCGTCTYYSIDDSAYTGGWCQWASFNSVPVAFPESESSTYRTWGEDCPCWEADDPVENVS